MFQGLSLLLNEQSYPFVIDLACLASRREFLKLEKWLTDKIQQQGETFVSACVKFLQVKVLILFTAIWFCSSFTKKIYFFNYRGDVPKSWEA